MKVVLDTHAWIWWVSSPDRLGSEAADAIRRAETIGVSAISCWELGMLVAKGRIALDRDPATWCRQALARPGVQALLLDPPIALAAAALGDTDMPGDPADRFIYATSRAVGATLLTRDRSLREYDPRGTLW